MHGGYSETSEGYDLSVSDYTEIRNSKKDREDEISSSLFLLLFKLLFTVGFLPEYFLYALYFFRGTHTVILLVDWSILEETFLSFKLLIVIVHPFLTPRKAPEFICVRPVPMVTFLSFLHL